MYNLFPYQLAKPIHYLVHDLKRLLLFELLPLYQLFQVSILAELCDDIQAVFGAENVFELNNISMIKTLK